MFDKQSVAPAQKALAADRRYLVDTGKTSGRMTLVLHGNSMCPSIPVFPKAAAAKAGPKATNCRGGMLLGDCAGWAGLLSREKFRLF